MTAAWVKRALQKQQSLAHLIPKEWVLSQIPSPEEEPNAYEYVERILPSEENEITKLSATVLSKQIANGQLKALSVAQAFCHRAALVQQLTNCCIEIFFDRAFQRAKELDEYFEKYKKTVGPLHGVPISLKDQLNIEGLDSSIGFIGLLDHPKTKEEESNLVTILRNAGAVFYVKTAVPMAMMSPETVSNIIGHTLSGVNRKLSSGGSSGGEGALIASRGSPFGVGTDIGGSIRIPAAFNGIYGWRPTTGRIPYCNVTNSMPDQPVMPSVIGPLAHELEDIELFAKVVIDSEPWIDDPKCVAIPWKPVTFSPGEKLSFGVMKWDKIVMPHPPILRAIKMATEALQNAGHEVIEWEAQDHPSILDTAHDIFGADDHAYIKEHCDLSGEPVVKEVLSSGNLPDTPHPKTVPQHWEHARQKYQHQIRYFKYWKDTASRTSTGRPVDAWISPLWESTSFRPGDSNKVSITYSPIQNVLDCPSVITPITTVDKSIDKLDPNYQPTNPLDKTVFEYYDEDLYEGSPVALQVITRRWEDEKAIALSRVLTDALKVKG